MCDDNKIKNVYYKVTQCCDMMCPFCSEDSVPDGKHGDIMNHKFIDSLSPNTHISVDGGNILSHPHLFQFLKKCKELNLITDISINQIHFEKNEYMIKKLVDDGLVNRIFVSFSYSSDNFINMIKKYENIVVSVILGVITEDQIISLMYHDLSISVLGYKTVGRGKTLYENARDEIEKRRKSIVGIIPQLLHNKAFKKIYVDDLASRQIRLSGGKFEGSSEGFYCCKEETSDLCSFSEFSTIFVDGVSEEFYINNCSEKRFPLKTDINQMYNYLMRVYSGGTKKRV